MGQHETAGRQVPNQETLASLAFAGDLSMGQPPEHSPRTAWLAVQLARASGAVRDVQERAAILALIRWAGCTANAREFSDLLGDDVRGRAEYIAGRNPFVAAQPPDPASMHAALTPMAAAHCEAVAMIAARLGLDSSVARAAEDYFENWDGSGLPRHRQGEAIDEATQYVVLASDIEVYARSYGLTRAAVLIEGRGGKTYDPALAKLAVRQMPGWLDELPATELLANALQLTNLHGSLAVDSAVFLLADFADLKRPEQTGGARLAYALARDMAQLGGYAQAEQDIIAQAAALAELGHVALANTALSAGLPGHEGLRLAPHWTDRILSRMPSLMAPAKLAAMAYERLDGSGFSRALPASAQPFEARIVQVARLAATTRLNSALDGGWPVEVIRKTLDFDSHAGLLDPKAVRLALEAMGARRLPVADAGTAFDLTVREIDVLHGLVRGRSNKEIARNLDLSPSTVGTHMEKIFRKLGVSSRAAAAMAALDAGLMAESRGGV